MIRAVLDANVLISSLTGREDRAPRQLIDAWHDGRFALVVSPLLVAELRRVLSYPKLARWAGDDRGARWIDAVVSEALMRPDPDTAPVGFTDAQDEYLIALASGPDVDYLVSGDLALVTAMTAATAAAAPTAARLTVITPRAFADLLE